MEFALYGLAEYSLISKHYLSTGHQFKDLLSSMFSLPKDESEDAEDDEAAGGLR
jgi:magnesium chelatase subunit I